MVQLHTQTSFRTESKLSKFYASTSTSGRSSPQFFCRATTRTYQPQTKPLIKICGVTNPSDADLVSKAGADFVGMIFWPKARRSVSLDTATRISEVAHKNGAEPVAVFVDEDFAEIVRVCKSTGIKTAQLHGRGAREALQDLPSWLQVIYVLHAGPDGRIQTKASQLSILDSQQTRGPEWMLIDGIKGGSGETYDWDRLQPPESQPGMKGWLLAGGLNPGNVGRAVTLLSPTGVDVSSGVTTPDGLLKDPDKVFKFVEEVRRAALEKEKISAKV